MDAIEGFLAAAPLWLVGVLFFAVLALAFRAGAAFKLRFGRGEAEGDDSVEGYLLSAVLALLGLLVAFTFSLSLSRYDSRRELVVAEGNALGTAWLRSTLVPGAEGEDLRTALRGYADIRLELPRAKNIAPVEARSAQAQAAVWQRLQAAVPKVDPPIAATLVNATTEMFDAASSRKAEREARIPGRVLDVVCLYAVMSAAVIGYVIGRRGGWRHAVVSHALFALLVLAIALILDLDRPWSGGITISAQPIADARAAMN